jgi:citrate synthase
MSEPTKPWETRISDADATHLWIRGHDVTQLMKTASFTDVMYLLHHERLPTSAERRILDAILIGVADHGPGSPSAAAARLVASGSRQAPEAAIAAGVLAIGDVHGGACMAAMEWIGGILADRGATLDEATLEAAAAEAVRQATQRKERIPGFGHRVHRDADPRTETLIELAREHGVLGEGVHFMQAVERELESQVKRLPLNIDGVLAAVLHDIGCSPLFSKCLFVIGRAAGLSAQVAEEYEHERPMRIRIPVRYVGAAPIAESPDEES